jgi:predicted tellurium resistance membrane protein TerC
VGGISGVVLLRFAAFILVKVMDKMTGVEHMAYVLVAWVAVKLSFMSAHSYSIAMKWDRKIAEMDKIVFWVGMGIILIAGIYLAKKGAKSEGELAENLEVLEEEVSEPDKAPSP